MALIKCSKCGNEIDDISKYCSNCGCPIRRYNNNILIQNKNGNIVNKFTTNSKITKNHIIIIIVVSIVLICIIFLFSTKDINLYRFNNSITIYEGITLKRFGKCYYTKRDVSNIHYKIIDETNACIYTKNGNNYSIIIYTTPIKIIDCQISGKIANCRTSNETIQYKID